MAIYVDEVANTEENKNETGGDVDAHAIAQKQQKSKIKIEVVENANKDIENSSLETAVAAATAIKNEEISNNTNPVYIKKELEEVIKQEDDKSDGEIQPDSKDQENENQV